MGQHCKRKSTSWSKSQEISLIPSNDIRLLLFFIPFIKITTSNNNEINLFINIVVGNGEFS